MAFPHSVYKDLSNTACFNQLIKCTIVHRKLLLGVHRVGQLMTSRVFPFGLCNVGWCAVNSRGYKNPGKAERDIRRLRRNAWRRRSTDKIKVQ